MILAWLAACAPPSEVEPRPTLAEPPNQREPGGAELRAPEPSALERAFGESCARLRAAFGPAGRVERRGPFAIGAPDDPDLWRRFVDGTLLGSAERLHAQLFPTRPTGPIEVYLFHGAEAYREGARALTGRAPTTPYGFYESQAKRLILDLATGGGTLVHELVHALVDADCPQLPAWINEGLGSLFEACRFEDRRLVGSSNWRLPVLRRAWEAGDWEPSLAELPTLDDATFYGALSSRHYALARHAMFFLQERGALERFVASYRAQKPADASGKRALETALDGALEEHEEEFRRFVRTLR
jgi:hypothetical protein